MKRLHHFATFEDFETYSHQHKVVNFSQVADWNRKFGRLASKLHGYMVLRDTATGECNALHYLIPDPQSSSEVIIGVWYGWALPHHEKILNKLSATAKGCVLRKATFFCEVDRQPQGYIPTSVVYTNKFRPEYGFKRPDRVIDLNDIRLSPDDFKRWLVEVESEHTMCILPYQLSNDVEYEMLLSQHGFNAQRNMFEFYLN